MISRARNGSIIIKTDKSAALEDVIKVKSEYQAGGKIIINSDKDVRFQNINAEYREYIEKIYAKYVSDSNDDDSDTDDSDDEPDDIPDDPPPPVTIPDDDDIEEPKEEKDIVAKVIEAYNSPVLTEEQESLVRTKDYESYQKRQEMKQNMDGGKSDMTDFVDLLYGDLDLQSIPGSLLKSIPDGSEEFVKQYRKYLQIISATVLYAGKKDKHPEFNDVKHDDH
jgi:hypothetical protein